jgi:hypothetical protein
VEVSRRQPRRALPTIGGFFRTVSCPRGGQEDQAPHGKRSPPEERVPHHEVPFSLRKMGEQMLTHVPCGFGNHHSSALPWPDEITFPNNAIATYPSSTDPWGERVVPPSARRDACFAATAKNLSVRAQWIETDSPRWYPTTDTCRTALTRSTWRRRQD